MITKPSNLVYGVEDKPTPLISSLMGVQHFLIFAISMVIPVILAREIGATLDQTVALVCMSMIAGGIGTLMQGFNGKYFGSGYLCPSVCSPSFLSASLLAGKTGGLSLLFGMLMVSGFAEMIFSRVIHKLRALFPPEVTGLIVMMVGISVVKLAVTNFVGIDATDRVITPMEILTGLCTLGIILGLNVWSKGKLKLYCVLIGMLAGYAMAYSVGIMKDIDHGHISKMPIADFQLLKHPGWSFSWYLVVPFIIAMLSSTLKSVGDLTTCQKANDKNWKRTDMMNVKKGILADALSCFSAGLVGGSAQSTSSANVGLSLATGTTSRRIAFYFGLMLIVLSFFPPIGLFFAIMPKPVMGATLIFAVSFMIAAGIQIITSRMLDARKTFVIGISLILGLSVDISPSIYKDIHPYIQPVFSSSLAAATVFAIVLNLLFRIGIDKKENLRLFLDKTTNEKIDVFLDKKGAAWGARKEVITKVKQTLFELTELLSLFNYAEKDTEIFLQVAFNEIRIDVDVSYQGKKIIIDKKRPEPDELLHNTDGVEKMSKYLLSSYADNIKQSSEKQTQHITMDFAH